MDTLISTPCNIFILCDYNPLNSIMCNVGERHIREWERRRNQFREELGDSHDKIQLCSTQIPTV